LDYVFYTKNGVDLGIKYTPTFLGDPPSRSVSEDGVWRLRPAVTAKQGAMFIGNFGQEPFVNEAMEALRQAALLEAGAPVRVKASAATAGEAAKAATDGASLATALPSTLAELLLKADSAPRSSDVVSRAVMLLEVVPLFDAASVAKVSAVGIMDLQSHGSVPVLSHDAEAGGTPVVVALASQDADVMASGATAALKVVQADLLSPEAASPSAVELVDGGMPDPAARLPHASHALLARAATLSAPTRSHPAAASRSHSLASADRASVGSDNPLLAKVSGPLHRAHASIELALRRWLPESTQPCSKVSKEEDGSLEKDAMELLRFVVFGTASLIPPGPDGSMHLIASDKECSALLRAMEKRSSTCLQRITAVEDCRKLVETLQSPSCVQEVLWALGSVLGAASISVESPNAEDFESGVEKNQAEKPAALGSSDNLRVCPLLSLLEGAGAGMILRLRTSLHSLLLAVADQLVWPAALPVASRSLVTTAPRLSSARRMVQLLALRVWRLPLQSEDHSFLASCDILPRLRQLMSAQLEDDIVGSDTKLVACRPSVTQLHDITSTCSIQVASGKDRLFALTVSRPVSMTLSSLTKS
jgi:hypothetical protein